MNQNDELFIGVNNKIQLRLWCFGTYCVYLYVRHTNNPSFPPKFSCRIPFFFSCYSIACVYLNNTLF